MTFKILYFNKTALHIAVDRCDSDIVQILLMRKEVDVNTKYIVLTIFIF